MIPLILTIVCSTVIVLILKYSHIQKGHPAVLLCGNYFSCSIISLILFFSEKEFVYSYETFLFGTVLGLIFFLGFFVFAKAVSSAGASLSTVSSRLSVIIPLSLSIIIFGEIPDYFQLSGIIIAVLTIFFFYLSVKKFSSGSFQKVDYFYLLAVLILIGTNDFSFKIFQSWRPASENNLFILTIFSFAFVYSFSYIILKKIKPDTKTILAGIVLGVPNIFSSYFLLESLNQLPAIIVYPSINIGIILLTSLAAFLIWKEELNVYGWWAMGFGITAIFLLSL